MNDLTGPGTSQGKSGKPWRGVNPTEVGRSWSVPMKSTYAKYIEKHFIPNYKQISSIHKRLDALDKAGLILWNKKRTKVYVKQYLASDQGHLPQDIICLLYTSPSPRD